MDKTKKFNSFLDEIISETGLRQEDIAKQINYDNTYLSQARKNPTEKLYSKLQDYIEKFRESKKSQPKAEDSEQDIKKPDTLHIALRGNQVLYDANRDLAYANRRLADAHYMLAESNRELVMALINSGKTFGIPPTFADPGMTPGDAEGSQRMTSGRKKKAG
jgi:hypothetical protein